MRLNNLDAAKFVLVTLVVIGHLLEQVRHVSEVVKAVGVEGLNQLWDDPLNAPSIEEIASPLTWVHRVIDTDYLGRDS